MSRLAMGSRTPEGSIMPEQQTTEPTASATAATGSTAKGATAPTGQQAQAGQAANEPLGEPGKKALEAEREARKQAETQLAALRTDFEGFKASLSEAFGVKPATGDNSDALQQMQEQVNTMQRNAAVYRLAAENSITDEGDLELLRSAKDEAAMTKLAGRLAAKADPTGTPKPDTTQGRQTAGGGAGSPEQDFANFLGAQLG